MEPILIAGLDGPAAPPSNPRRELIRNIRAVLRRTDASEDEDLDALEALVELSRE